MSSKDDIIESIRESLGKREKVPYPTIPTYEKEGTDLLETFKKNLEIAGGTWHEVNSVEEAQAIMKEQLPNAKVICSATEEWVGTKDITKVERPQDLEDVDLGVIRAEFGVAEMGMVYFTEKSLKINSIGFLSQHLAVFLDPEKITENMHTAYKIVDFWNAKYGNFTMGPSATADIQATLVHGAQGARSLTLFFLKE